MKIIYLFKEKSEQSKGCIGKFVAIDSISLKIEFSFIIKNDSGVKLIFDTCEDEKVFEKNIILGSNCIMTPLNIVFSNDYEEISSYVSTIVPNLIKAYLNDKKVENAQS